MQVILYFGHKGSTASAVYERLCQPPVVRFCGNDFGTQQSLATGIPAYCRQTIRTSDSVAGQIYLFRKMPHAEKLSCVPQHRFRNQIPVRTLPSSRSGVGVYKKEDTKHLGQSVSRVIRTMSPQ